MVSGNFPVEDFIPREVTVQIGQPYDFSDVPPSSPIFDNQSWHEAAAVLDAAGADAIRPVHLLVGETQDASSVAVRKVDEDSEENTVTFLLQPEIEVLPVGSPQYYDSETGQRVLDTEEPESSVSGANDDALVADEVGLFRVDKGALQASAAIVIEQAMLMAYVAGRLDQANTGTNRERFVKARDLELVAANAEWLAESSTRGRHGERARRVIQNAIRKFGSVTKALEVET